MLRKTFFDNSGKGNASGTFVASASDGTQSVSHGVWVSVGDRKYTTVFVFSYNDARTLAAVNKIRINLQVSLDGQNIISMDRTGKVLPPFRVARHRASG